MFEKTLSAGLAAVAAWGVLLLAAPDAAAQGPVVAYYPQPVVTYVPVVRGLFGQRLVYRPVVSVPVPLATFYAPAPVARAAYFAPAPAAVETYYAPAAPILSYPAQVTTYYAPAAPILSYPARVTTYYAPVRVVAPRVISYYPPWIVP
jgi:hypothetical protein